MNLTHEFIAIDAGNVLVNQLANIPQTREVSDMLRTYEIPPSYIVDTYLSYLRLIHDAVTLSPDDIKLIEQANTNRLTRENKVSTTHDTSPVFLEAIGQERLKDIMSSAFTASDINSSIFFEALDDLEQRMAKGSELFEKKVETTDGASADADYAIWGHTKGLTPKAMVHFVMCHLFARAFTAKFSDDESPEIQKVISKKDALLGLMGDVIRLRQAQGKDNPWFVDIVRMWEDDHVDGGLQWNTKARQQDFDQAVANSINTSSI